MNSPARPTGTAARASTVALVTIVASQLGQTLITGDRSPLVLATSLGSFAVLGAIVQMPGMSQLFGCRPLGPLGWATALAVSGGATAASLVLPRLLDATEPWTGSLRDLVVDVATAPARAVARLTGQDLRHGVFSGAANPM